MKIIKIASLSLIMMLSGCIKEYQEITPKELESKLSQSAEDSIGSWLYYGEDDNHYYFIKIADSGREFYKVQLNQIEVAHQFKHSSRKSAVLKKWHIRFKKK